MTQPYCGLVARCPQLVDAPIHSSENTVACGDPGAETANRYRFQWTWAAILCCMLLDDTEDVESANTTRMFCSNTRMDRSLGRGNLFNFINGYVVLGSFDRTQLSNMPKGLQ